MNVKNLYVLFVFVLLLPRSVEAMVDTSSAEVQLPIEHLVTLRLRGTGWILDAERSFQNSESLVSLLEIAEIDQNTDFVLYKKAISQDNLVFTRYNLESGNEFTLFLVVQWRDMVGPDVFEHKEISVLSMLPLEDTSSVTGYLAETTSDLPVQSQSIIETLVTQQDRELASGGAVAEPASGGAGSTAAVVVPEEQNEIAAAIVVPEEQNEIAAAIDSLEDRIKLPDKMEKKEENLISFMQEIDTYAQNKQLEEGRAYGLVFLENIENYDLRAEGHFLLAQFLEQNSSSVQDIRYALELYRLVVMDYRLSEQYSEALNRITVLEDKYLYFR